MLEFIALIILLCSLSGIGVILWKKIPILVQLPETHEGIQKENIVSILKKKIKAISPEKIILLKAVSKIRVLVLKFEKYIDIWLQGMRKKIHIQNQEQQKQEKEEQKQNGSQNPPIIPPTMPE